MEPDNTPEIPTMPLANDDVEAPGAALEEAITAGREGRITNREVMSVIWTSELLSVGRLTKEDDPSTFQAVVLKAPDADYSVAATFTSPDRIPAQLREAAPVVVRASGEATIRSIAPGYGMSVNPGHEVGLEIGPDVVASLVEAYEKTAAQAQDPAAPEQG
ncbi:MULTISPECIES: SseB family protein [Arthrobacter]|uniref:SseB family protein n=1 Tax=Arthrobacter jinronghuae TaxID=2964609 RepID=A0ABT1NRC0_9MICC|nr:MULTISPECIES: SseB family protein [Arthrobacter]MCQ1948999.1 SseB family protein [Arthrobacter jinronghuae]MCQ1952325.1 SseB family protein [Arthrobacter sp. zg-Y238]MCQ1955558.1 SseB family protein [Arthrobacter jinronghuae]UWX78201.1 SseB family protein [Arthrobacter jinronghuae]